MTDKITGTLFKRMMLHGAAAIAAEKQAVNDLNVFPVPDGDTGTNMSMTMDTAAAELEKQEPESVGRAASVTASALLRGARGNSGVILSLLFRGLARGLKGLDTAGTADFSAAMQEGVSAAYKAVMKPAEGTVLTVSRLSAKAAADKAAEGERDMEALLSAAIQEGYDALAQTTEMNPVLKKAGVVDAGGKGYLLILEGMLSALRGEALPERGAAASAREKADFAALTDEEITFAFDTVFIVRKKPGVSLAPFREYLNSIGDSLVIGEDDEAFKVHVHTDTPGYALNEARRYGTLELAKIENMRLQYEDISAGRKTRSTDDLEAVEAELEAMEGDKPGGMDRPGGGGTGDAPKAGDGGTASPQGTAAGPEAEPGARKKFGFLSVCSGSGIAEIFRNLGVDGVVSGGQTMNPSTESILSAVERIPADTVFILPNNSNIIMAARQCADLTEKTVVVIPTRTVPQGITAMMNVDFECEDRDALAQAMEGSLESVRTAQITYAARDSDYDGFNIRAGDYLALDEGKLFGTDHSLDSLLRRIADAPEKLDASFISLYYGEDVTEAEAQVGQKIFEAACPDAEVAVLPGGQPVYYYIISIE